MLAVVSSLTFSFMPLDTTKDYSHHAIQPPYYLLLLPCLRSTGPPVEVKQLGKLGVLFVHSNRTASLARRKRNIGIGIQKSLGAARGPYFCDDTGGPGPCAAVGAGEVPHVGLLDHELARNRRRVDPEQSSSKGRTKHQDRVTDQIWNNRFLTILVVPLK
jgi:hypothetical protein